MRAQQATELRGPYPAAIRPFPRLSPRAGFWAIAPAFLTVTALSTAPSSLYGLIAQREGLTALTITLVYAVYAIGVVASLLVIGHISD